MDRLQEDTKKSNRDFHDDTKRIYLHGIHWSSNGFLHKLWVLAWFLACLFYFSWNCWKYLLQGQDSTHEDCDYFTRKMSQTKHLGTLKNHSSGLVFYPAYFKGIWKRIVLTSLKSTSTAPLQGLEELIQRGGLASCHEHSCFSGRLYYVFSGLYFYKNLLNVPNKCQNAVSVAVLFSSNPTQGG